MASELFPPSLTDEESSDKAAAPEVLGTYCFAKKGEFVTRSIAGETILVPVRGQVGDLDAIYNLNEVGTFIWERVDGITSVSQIAGAVAAEFEVTSEEAEKDTLLFIDALAMSGVIERTGRRAG